jgi:hypothetical protein
MLHNSWEVTSEGKASCVTANKMGICTLLVFWFFQKGHITALNCHVFLPLSNFFLVNYHKISAPKTKRNFVVQSLFLGKIFVTTF